MSTQSEIESGRLAPPDGLLSKAKVVGGVRWWPTPAALEAIEWYASQGVAVIGADLAYLRSGKTFATLEAYDGSPRGKAQEEWSRYVTECAEAARTFVKRHRHDPDAYFDLTVVARDQLAESEAP